MATVTQVHQNGGSAVDPLRLLFMAGRNVTYYCSSSSSKFDVWSILRCASSHHCIEWLSRQLKPVTNLQLRPQFVYLCVSYWACTIYSVSMLPVSYRAICPVSLESHQCRAFWTCPVALMNCLLLLLINCRIVQMCSCYKWLVSVL